MQVRVRLDDDAPPDVAHSIVHAILNPPSPSSFPYPAVNHQSARVVVFAAATIATFGVSAASVQFAAQPSQLNILLVSATTTTSTAAVLNEMSSSAPAAPVQSLSITGCTIGAVATGIYGSVTLNGYYGLFPCGYTGSATRLIARVTSAGLVDTRCVPTELEASL